jgi:hypothetical protein
VSADSTSIPTYSYQFTEFECGHVQVTGGIEAIDRDPPYPITDGQFTIETHDYYAGWDIAFQGQFDETGMHASGTWEITTEETTCSGTWESSQ